MSFLTFNRVSRCKLILLSLAVTLGKTLHAGIHKDNLPASNLKMLKYSRLQASIVIAIWQLVEDDI